MDCQLSVGYKAENDYLSPSPTWQLLIVLLGGLGFPELLQSMSSYWHSQSFAGPGQAITAAVRLCLQRLCHTLKLDFDIPSHLASLLQCFMSFTTTGINNLFRTEHLLGLSFILIIFSSHESMH